MCNGLFIARPHLTRDASGYAAFLLSIFEKVWALLSLIETSRSVCIHWCFLAFVYVLFNAFHPRWDSCERTKWDTHTHFSGDWNFLPSINLMSKQNCSSVECNSRRHINIFALLLMTAQCHCSCSHFYCCCCFCFCCCVFSFVLSSSPDAFALFVQFAYSSSIYSSVVKSAR